MPGPVDEGFRQLDHELTERARTVRPYTLTRGRTRPGRDDLPVEALVRGANGLGPASTPPTAGSPESRAILDLSTREMLSVAELSAHLSLPLGVVRVLVGDLADEGLVFIYSSSTQSPAPAATQLKVLESVLNGITSL